MAAAAHHARGRSFSTLGSDSPLRTRGHTPPLSPARTASRTATCPSSPVPASCASPLGSRSTTGFTTPARRVSTGAYAFDGPGTLPNIVTSSIYESNIAAAACFANYDIDTLGRYQQLAQPAPPLADDPADAPLAAMRSAPSSARPSTSGLPSAAVSLQRNLHHDNFGLSGYGSAAAATAAAAGGMAAHFDTVSASLSDLDFGLAACLATPLNPESTTESNPTRPVSVSASNSSAANTARTAAGATAAAVKLNSADEVLSTTSRYGDWARRVRRRRRLEMMQGVLSSLGQHVVLGRLRDDTLHDYGRGPAAEERDAEAALAAAGGRLRSISTSRAGAGGSGGGHRLSRNASDGSLHTLGSTASITLGGAGPAHRAAGSKGGAPSRLSYGGSTNGGALSSVPSSTGGAGSGGGAELSAGGAGAAGASATTAPSSSASGSAAAKPSLLAQSSFAFQTAPAGSLSEAAAAALGLGAALFGAGAGGAPQRSAHSTAFATAGAAHALSGLSLSEGDPPARSAFNPTTALLGVSAAHGAEQGAGLEGGGGSLTALGSLMPCPTFRDDASHAS